MFDKLDFILEKYEELSQKVSDPAIINNQPVWQKYVKEMGEMEPIVKKYKEYKKAKSELADAKEMLEESDEEMRELAKMEISELEETIGQQEEDLKVLLLPKDPNDEKNVILEVRAGTGGEEAALFGSDLLRMYSRYAERKGWKTTIPVLAASRKRLCSSRAKALIPGLNTKAAPIASSEYPRPNPAAEFIRRRLRWRCCLRWTTWKWISIPMMCG